jgi:hypothetical protein
LRKVQKKSEGVQSIKGKHLFVISFPFAEVVHHEDQHTKKTYTIIKKQGDKTTKGKGDKTEKKETWELAGCRDGQIPSTELHMNTAYSLKYISKAIP